MVHTVILGVADSIPEEIPNFSDLSREQAVEALLKTSVSQLFSFLKLSERKQLPLVTDFISFGPSIYHTGKYHDTLHKAQTLGLTGMTTHTIDMGGASVAAALEYANNIIKSNPQSYILIAGADVPRSGFQGMSDFAVMNDNVSHNEFEADYDCNLISLYGLLAKKQMLDSEIKQQHFEEITQHYRQLSITNRRAFNYNKLLKERALKRMYGDPYTGPMIAVATDHGFATLICSEQYYKENLANKIDANKKPLYIQAAASATHTAWLSFKKDLESPAKISGLLALYRANLSPEDIDYAYVYDCFPGMLIKQAAEYFSLKEKKAADTLTEGYLQVKDKHIPVNTSGGILNYRAALMASGATGLMDVLSHYALSSHHLGLEPADFPKLSLLGGNGGIDSMNTVVILSRDSPLDGKPDIHPPPFHSKKLSFNQPLKKENDNGVIWLTTVVHFHPGGNKPTPYVVVLVKLENGNFTMSNVFKESAEGFVMFKRDDQLQNKKIIFKNINGVLQAVLV